MQAQREVVRFLAAYQEVWFRHFPDLHRRGHWHLASHVCVRARDGAPVGELSGMVKQVFLLDDATVRERLGELVRLGFCDLDPADRPVAARTLVLPSMLLTTTFDRHLQETAGCVLQAARAVDPSLRGTAPAHIEMETRRRLLGVIERCDDAWIAALEQLLEAKGLSVARRIEARRHLLSPSHRALTLMALRHRYGLLSPDESDGILADEMAAELLRLQRQNFQTTRDHISALLQLGLLQRCAGRSLRVALTDGAGREFDQTLAPLIDELSRAAVALRFDDPEQTGLSHRLPDAAPPLQELLVTRDGEPAQRFMLGSEPVIVGRAPSSGLILADNEVSRAHCQIALVDGEISVTDLDSTNGTFIDGGRISGTGILPIGAQLQIGPFRVTRVATRNEDLESTLRPLRAVRTAEGA